MENIDIQIGRVLKKLEALGELENTYIFYTADHGTAIRLSFKQPVGRRAPDRQIWLTIRAMPTNARS